MPSKRLIVRRLYYKEALFAVVDVETKLETEREILDAVIKGCTKWRDNFEKGRDMWEYSGQEFNLGDMGVSMDEDLRNCLKEFGIEDIEINVHPQDESTCWFYDTVLMQEEEGDDSF